MLALVRRPGPRLAEGLVTHIERQDVDVELAAKQWEAYVEVLAVDGWDIVEVEGADTCPDAAFVEDTAVMFGSTALLCRPGAEERRAEVDGTATVLEGMGYAIERITAPATMDGGDVLKVGTHVFVGVGGRTNIEGVEQLTRIVEPLGRSVTTVPTTRVLHLKSAVTALPDGTIVGYRPVVDEPSCFTRFLAVPEEAGAHVVLLGEDRLLMAADAERSAEMLASRGYTLELVDIGEFQKLEGCVTCLSIRLRAQPGIR